MDVFGGCIRWVYTGDVYGQADPAPTVDVFGGCIRWMYTVDVFGDVFGHPQGMPLPNINTHRRGGVGPPEYINE